ncbi:hypothetical protein DAI22_09g087950 [Oryza sativa Japonica Group]|nr:hypothetical protein DAI22_09g087950 [Oryza sativa Japonica Group]
MLSGRGLPVDLRLVGGLLRCLRRHSAGRHLLPLGEASLRMLVLPCGRSFVESSAGALKAVLRSLLPCLVLAVAGGLRLPRSGGLRHRSRRGTGSSAVAVAAED